MQQAERWSPLRPIRINGKSKDFTLGGTSHFCRRTDDANGRQKTYALLFKNFLKTLNKKFFQTFVGHIFCLFIVHWVLGAMQSALFFCGTPVCWAEGDAPQRGEGISVSTSLLLFRRMPSLFSKKFSLSQCAPYARWIACLNHTRIPSHMKLIQYLLLIRVFFCRYPIIKEKFISQAISS